MVLNTQCFPYLWLMMWFHAKKIQRKKCWLSYVDSVPRLRNYQKYTKKTLHSLLSPFLSLLKSYYVLRLYSEIVFRGCAEAMYKHDYGCDREMQVLAVIIKLFFEIIRDNFFVICHHWLQKIFYFTFAASHSYWSKRKSKASEFDMYDDDISKLRN